MSNIASSARARGLGVDVVAKNLRTATQNLPQQIMIVGQPNTGETPPSARALVTSANDVGTNYGFGSPLHQAAMGVFANQKGIPVYVAPLADGTTAATGSLTATGTSTAVGTIQLTVGGYAGPVIAIPSGTVAADVPALLVSGMSGEINSPVTFADGTGGALDLTAKWKGESGNDIKFSASADTAGLTFVAVAMALGAGDPDPATVLDAQLGEDWITILVNCMAATTGTLASFSAKSETRWAADVRRAFITVTGFNGADLATASAITSPLTSDRTNHIEPVIDSPSLIAQIAGAKAAIIAIQADTNPARDYATAKLVGIVPGADTAQPNPAERDAALKLGVGHSKVIGNAVYVADSVTPYRLPAGETDPLYRYVVTLQKVWQGWYALEQTFTSPAWNGAPLVPNGQTTRPSVGAKSPNMAIAEVKRIIDGLALSGIYADPETAKGTIVASINESNPNRLDISFTAQVTGNTNIIAVDYGVGFYFGEGI